SADQSPIADRRVRSAAWIDPAVAGVDEQVRAESRRGLAVERQVVRLTIGDERRAVPLGAVVAWPDVGVIVVVDAEAGEQVRPHLAKRGLMDAKEVVLRVDGGAGLGRRPEAVGVL